MSTELHLGRLFQPGQIAKMSPKNRIVMPAMGTRYPSSDGCVTKQLKDFYEERAKGGTGLIVVEATCVDTPLGKRRLNELNIDDNRYIPGLHELAGAIKKHGTMAAIQLNHAGSATNSRIIGQQPLGPSAVVLNRKGYDPAVLHSWHYEPAREATLAEIQSIVIHFAEGAERAKKAGFDGVEIHGGHCYLIARFLSRAWNKRQDNYGGDLKNRARLLVETMVATKQAVGRCFPVWCRLNALEFGVEDGITLEESKEVARMAQEAGADAIHVSCWGYGVHALDHRPNLPGAMLPLAEVIKGFIDIPVIAVGRIDPYLGEMALREKRADFIAIGRGLLADPNLPNKARTGRLEDIVPCLACNHCWPVDAPIRCSVNPALGREREFAEKLKRVRKKKKVLVIGGGPAGIQSALIASEKGHDATLWEKGNQLGGQLLIASKPPHKEGLRDYVKYLIRQTEKAKIKIELKKEAQASNIRQFAPDAVILATGARPRVPNIKGLAKDEVLTFDEVLSEKVRLQGKTVIIGGGFIGCEMALFLVERGCAVTILEILEELAADAYQHIQNHLRENVAAKRIKTYTGVKDEEMVAQGIRIKDKNGKEILLEADSIVLACGCVSSDTLSREIQGEVAEIYRVGDCTAARNIIEATREGAEAAMKL